MLIENDVNNKLTSVWVTNAERDSEIVKAQIKELAKENKARKHRTAVFCSGEGEIYDNTESLIIRNITR